MSKDELQQEEIKTSAESPTGRHASVASRHVPIEQTEKSRWDRMWPIIACGAGLFSDGYLNAVCSTKSPIKTMSDQIHRSSAQ
jgi:hypothetical protein